MRLVNAAAPASTASGAGMQSSGFANKDSQATVLDAIRRSVAPLGEERHAAPPKALRHRLPGERFIRMAKEGSTVSGLMDSFATAVSLALQHGVPLKLLCDKLQHTRFEP